MYEIIILLASVCIFALLAKYTDRCVYLLFSVIKGGTLILMANWALELFSLSPLALNLFTAAMCGFLGLPAFGLLWFIARFF